MFQFSLHFIYLFRPAHYGSVYTQNILRGCTLPALTITDIMIIAKINPSGCGLATGSYLSPVIYPTFGSINIRDNYTCCLYRMISDGPAIFCPKAWAFLSKAETWQARFLKWKTASFTWWYIINAICLKQTHFSATPADRRHSYEYPEMFLWRSYAKEQAFIYSFTFFFIKWILHTKRVLCVVFFLPYVPLTFPSHFIHLLFYIGYQYLSDSLPRCNI